MNTTYKPLALVLILIVFLNSCTDTVDVDVPTGNARLVVEASIDWEKGTSGQTQTISLSESTSFFNNDPDLPVTGAIVTITKDDDGTQFSFEDQNNGNYITTNFIPELDQSYTLEIFYNSQIYRASETLASVTEINTIEQTIEGAGDEEEIQIKVFFDDPINIENYYLGEFNSSVNPLLTLTSLSDQFTDGNENFIEFDNEELVPGAIVDISIYGISEQYYNFISILIEQSGENDGPFQSIPVQLKGNCFNINNPDEEVLGYFRLTEVVRTSYTIE
ncbi:DUF4249 family protein [Psychroserpens sp.]|uniref:DUF4249 family protein n=1 Tax=Psychroserpens sp. TaxID=2020870 RepID=UPI001AFF9403|nr:DUF4249 family protein [Psychroserpens sp.]MBO6606892.1 DUF4249 domain-containing protein [Psychroserpens sp.]MBO6630574.1 DUF4249 domain-containing protein [Psychroserpens sp.]MBO6654038.1 DUF4249 domain-containing protein [Psychroserpens sp.]MBO6682676.1 DUF4249 domain-containing protein [Psychroserpens sp.]MBO6750664.1 DUF4249 domain-containing protein [Psychroserpens sp.]